jgi:ATP-binding cassette subfamily F protein 3
VSPCTWTKATLTRYGGNYSAFEEHARRALTQAQAAFGKQQDRIAHLQRFIDRFKAKASKAKQAQSRVKALARMEKLAPVLMASDFQFEFREPAEPAQPHAQPATAWPAATAATHPSCATSTAACWPASASASWAPTARASRRWSRPSPAAAPLGGTITEGKGLAIGYFAQQELDVLSADDGPLQHMVRLARDVGPAGARAGTARLPGPFRFTGDMVQQAVGSL